MGGFFYNLGKRVGSNLRKANWVMRSLTGTEVEAVQAEYAVGRDLARALAPQLSVDADPAVEQFLDDLGSRLASRVKDRQRYFHFRAVRTPESNAFALPGGFIFVTRPLLELCQWDRDELAFVLGHEMGHVIRRHAIDRLMAQSAISVVTGKLSVGGLLGIPVARLLTTLLHQGYAQDQELEADRVGVRLAGSAGFDATAATRLLGRLRGQSGATGGLGSYLASHPPVEVRIQNLNSLLGG
jgi:predicted Zn-dependent protease